MYAIRIHYEYENVGFVVSIRQCMMKTKKLFSILFENAPRTTTYAFPEEKNTSDNLVRQNTQRHSADLCGAFKTFRKHYRAWKI